MREAIVFLLKTSAKYGILIFGAAWLLAVGSQMIFVRSSKEKNIARGVLASIIKYRIFIGIAILIVGMIFALIPIN